MFCTTCGVRSESEAQRFCTSCGAALPDGDAAPTVVTPSLGFPPSPPPPPPPAPQVQAHPAPAEFTLPGFPIAPLPAEETLPALPGAPLPRPVAPMAAPHRPPGRGRGPVLLIAAIAVLVALLGTLVTVVVLSGDDGRRTASDNGEPGEQGKDDSTADPDDASSGPDDPSSEPAASKPFACWNGVPAERLDDCTEPSGKQGMRWVFPQSKASTCSFTGGGTRVAESDCNVVVSSGGTVRVHYTEWADWDSAYAEYSGQNVQGAVTDWREFHRWYIRPLAGDWDYKVALLYRDAPWSVTVYGHTKVDRDEALRELSVRPVSDLMGRRE